MENLITGIHHITALASDPQKNLDFYAGILGLRFVKKTVNFDAPDVYHLYYGNENGAPGTIMTFFPYEGIPQGRKGKGQLTTTSFSVPENSLGFWMNRFDRFNIRYEGPIERFDETAIYFEDHDGLGLELVATKDPRAPFSYGAIPLEHAIRGIHAITLTEESYEKTAGLLVGQLDHKPKGEKGNRFRFVSSSGSIVDILCAPDALRGNGGYGTIHHIAFLVENDEKQIAVRNKLVSFGLNLTPVIDREYFHSIYFREPGGVLFEIATHPPGFTVDEPLEKLGTHLKLPPWYEKNREQIEKALTPISLDISRFK
ncbi:MAG: ring-cleaving dioxygenase [Parachlamydiaceae bacterium]